MGLICVSLRERKSVKRHSEAMNREIGRHTLRDGTHEHRDNRLSVISFLAKVVVHRSDKPSDDPASFPDPSLETQFTLSLDPISRLTTAALSVFTAGRNTDMVSLVIRRRMNVCVTTAIGAGYLN